MSDSDSFPEIHYKELLASADRTPKSGEKPRGESSVLYEVTFILHRPGYNLQQEHRSTISLYSSGLRGDSHLAISKPAFSRPGNPDADQIRIVGITEDGQFEFIGLPNEKGYALGHAFAAPALLAKEFPTGSRSFRC
jgi:hypothetical protein